MCNDQSESSQNFNCFSVKGLDGSNSSTVPLERFLLHFSSALMNQCLHDFSKQQSQQERAVQIQIHPVGFLRCSSFEDMLFYIYIYIVASKHRDKTTKKPTKNTIKHLHSYLDSLTGHPRWTGDFIRQRPCHGTASLLAGDHCPFPAVRRSLSSNQGPIIHMLHGICCLDLPIKTGTFQETNISLLTKRKIILKNALVGWYVSSLEGNCFRVLGANISSKHLG